MINVGGDMMYKIGEFSKITGLTVKTLRYYEDEGMLIPEKRLENGYRSYNEANYESACFLRSLRELKFSISEMKEIMSNCESESDLAYYLKEKKEFIKNNILKERDLMKEIDKFIVDNEEVNKVKRQYDIEMRSYDEVKIILKRIVGSIEDLKSTIPKLYKDAKSSACGPLITLYYDYEYKEELDMAVCLPVKKDINSKEYEFSKLESTKVLSTMHIGPYEEIHKAYKALFDYAKANEIELKLPLREIYIKGPGMIFKGNPDKYVTEVIFPILEI